MCGYDLRREPQRRRQISWLDALLVLAVLLVLIFWWQAGNRPVAEEVVVTEAPGIAPENIPSLPPTLTPVPPAEESTATPNAPSAPTGTVEHTVTSGETLLSISLDYGVTVEEIQRANGLTGVLIRIGDILVIPNQQAVAAAPGTAQSAPTGPASIFEYVVQDGDTIISIATRLGSTQDEILRANGLGETDFIRPGDKLNIPVRQVPAEVLESTLPEAPAAETEGAQPTATPSGIYSRPQLIAPADNVELPRTEAVLLRWASVDLLAPNEWYVALLYPQSPDARQFPSIWTKATSHRIELGDAPGEGQSATYSWQVSVVRVMTGAGGGYALEPASPASELRRFTWE